LATFQRTIFALIASARSWETQRAGLVLDRLRRAGKLDYLDDDLRARYAS
jgi:hypothetical protein